MNNKDAVSEFVNRYEAEKPMYNAWGEFVYKNIVEQLNMSKQELDRLIKIRVEPRVKSNDSIVEKAFFRPEKHYTDPINQITDKVGVRFVVMITDQIRIIENTIINSHVWEYSKDQDFQDAIEKKPDIFDYQSVHYIVRNKEDIDYDGMKIKKGTPCEIQIRTLEQHAYAELSHDYFYKKEEPAKSVLRRNLAKSMALNETTDELFSRVYNMMNEDKKEYTELMLLLKEIYPFVNYSEKFNKTIYDNISVLIHKHKIDIFNIKKFIEKYIIDSIAEKQDLIIFRQPVVLVLYYLVKYHRYELIEIWQQPKEQLELIYSDLGISYDD